MGPSTASDESEGREQDRHDHTAYAETTTMKTNPKTSDEFFSLPIGPEPGREISRGLFPMEEGDILRIDDQSAGISWRVWQYKDGERFRLRLGD